MGSVRGVLTRNARRIAIELIRGLQFRCAECDKKFDANRNTRRNSRQITEDPLSVAPSAILVEMVLVVGGGGGVGAEAVVVAQASLE